MFTNNIQYQDVLNQIKSNKQFHTATGKLNSAFLRRDHFLTSNLYRDIICATNFLDADTNIAERVYCIENSITTKPTCICGRVLKFVSNVQGYLKSCIKCIRKVGTVWNSSSSTAYCNIQQERKGFKQYVQDKNAPTASTQEVIDFIAKKQTNAAESIKWVSRSDYRDNKHILKQAILLTSYLPLDHNQYNWANRFYNIFHNTHNGQICVICKTSQTRFKNFIQGYSDCCPKKSCVQRHGCNSRINNHLATVLPVIESQGFKLITTNEYRGLNSEQATLHCDKCNADITYNISNANWKNIRCYSCYGEVGVSFEEKQVLEYVKQLTDGVLENQRIFEQSQKEVDIYIPQHKLAIEYNGSLWHSYGSTYPNNLTNMHAIKRQHREKHNLYDQLGINLLQINSYEWNNQHKRRVWESIISSKLGCVKRIYARKCVVVEISGAAKNTFLNNNHLQGMDNSQIKLGLMHENELVAVMTFAKPRFNKRYQWELVRFCNKLHHTVVGGASKLLQYFIKQHRLNNIISYADLRYSNGDMYKTLGFKYKTTTPPSYVYIRDDQVISRFTAQKHRLVKLLKNFDINKTEQQNMLAAGYRQLWDAGTMLFVYEKSTANSVD